MEWLLLALTTGGAVTYTARRISARRADRRAQAEILEEMRTLRPRRDVDLSPARDPHRPGVHTICDAARLA
jgi:hypothetical protein